MFSQNSNRLLVRSLKKLRQLTEATSVTSAPTAQRVAVKDARFCRKRTKLRPENEEYQAEGTQTPFREASSEFRTISGGPEDEKTNELKDLGGIRISPESVLDSLIDTVDVDRVRDTDDVAYSQLIAEEEETPQRVSRHTVPYRVDSEPLSAIPDLTPKLTPKMKFEQLCKNAEVQPKIAFIGGGNMGKAMIKGFLKSGMLVPNEIGVADPFAQALEPLKELGVSRETNNFTILSRFGGGVTILAVKPHILPQVLANCGDELRKCGLIVSIIAGAKLSYIEANLEEKVPVIRVMPNTPALIGAGASVYCKGKTATDAQCELVKVLLETVGTCREVPEYQVDAVTGLSGSGPAYVYTMIDALSDGGVKMGLPRDLAIHLAAQCVMGSAKMVLETGAHPGELKNMVCSPGGTTIAGVHALEVGGIRPALISAVQAATEKAKELGS